MLYLTSTLLTLKLQNNFETMNLNSNKKRIIKLHIVDYY